MAPQQYGIWQSANVRGPCAEPPDAWGKQHSGCVGGEGVNMLANGACGFSGSASTDAGGNRGTRHSGAASAALASSLTVPMPHAMPGPQHARINQLASGSGSGGGSSSGSAVGALALDLGCSRAGCLCVLTGMPCSAPLAAVHELALAGGSSHAALAPAAGPGPDGSTAPQGAAAAQLPALAGAASRAVPLHGAGALQLAEALLLEFGNPEEAAECAAWLAATQQ